MHQCRFHKTTGNIFYSKGGDWGWSPLCDECAKTVNVKHYREPAPCNHCGHLVAVLISTTNKKGKRRFCGRTCEGKFYGSQKPKPPSIIQCQDCGDTFTAKRSDARFCSVKCRVKAHRAAA
jgi:hypothetical protein